MCLLFCFVREYQPSSSHVCQPHRGKLGGGWDLSLVIDRWSLVISRTRERSGSDLRSDVGNLK